MIKQIWGLVERKMYSLQISFQSYLFLKLSEYGSLAFCIRPILCEGSLGKKIKCVISPMCCLNAPSAEGLGGGGQVPAGH